MKCKYCNSEINDNSKFCNLCGKKLINLKKINWKIRFRRWIITGAALCTIIVALLIFKDEISNLIRYDIVESNLETDIYEKENEENTIISYPLLKDEVAGIPKEGDKLDVKVSNNEIKVLTGGPVLINGVSLPGGADPDRGSIVVLLPVIDTLTEYNFSYLVAEHNWLGSYHIEYLDTNIISYIVNDKIDAMKKPPNGTSGL